MQTKLVLRADDIEKLGLYMEKNQAKTCCELKQKDKCLEFLIDEEREIKAREAITKAAREYIVKTFEKSEIRRIINRGYNFFDRFEKKVLEQDVYRAIEQETDIHDKLFVMRRNRIIESILEDYFNENNKLNLEGFLPFRLQDYSSELEDLIDYSADNFLMRREYSEFLELVSTYVKVQPNLEEVLNVVITENCEYIYYDSRAHMMNYEYEMEAKEEFEGEYGKDDLLVSILITKNPKKIVIHNMEYMKRETADTLRKIFGIRIVRCDGCSMCRILQ